MYFVASSWGKFPNVNQGVPLYDCLQRYHRDVIIAAGRFVEISTKVKPINSPISAEPQRCKPAIRRWFFLYK